MVTVLFVWVSAGAPPFGPWRWPKPSSFFQFLLLVFFTRFHPRGVLRSYVLNERKIYGIQIGESKFRLENSGHWSEEIDDEEVVKEVTDLLRRGDDWDWLSGRLGHIRLSDSIVEGILLQLKEPLDAKRGLGFFHWSSVRKKFDHCVRSYCILAQILFHARIDTHAKAMLESAVRKNSYCGSPFREDVFIKETFSNAMTTRIMVDAMCKQGLLQKIVDMLDRITGRRCLPGVIVNIALIIRLFEDNRVDEGILLLERMDRKNMVTDNLAYSLTIFVLCKLGNVEHALIMHDEILKSGFPANSFTFTSLIVAHCKDGRFEEFDQLVQEMVNQGLVPYDETYNFLIEGCCRAEKFGYVIRFYREILQKGLLPRKHAFNELLGKICEAGDIDKANDILTSALDKGFLPDELTYAHLIDAYSEMNNIEEVLKLYYEMEYRGPAPGLLTHGLLVRSFANASMINQRKI